MNAQNHIYQLTALQRQQLIEWNNTTFTFPQAKCIHELIEEQVEKTPNAIAALFEDSQLTYSELNAKANQLAHYLCELGIKPDTRVAICIEHSFDMLIGLLGILKAGGAYVPLDPTYPIDRLNIMLEDSQAMMLLTQSRFEILFSGISKNLPKVYLDTNTKWLNKPTSNLDCIQLQLTPQHLAYVIYTSGSTGKPKGVMIEHRNVVNFLCATSQRPGITNQDIILAFTTIAFDIAGSELLWPLINGAKIVLISRSNAINPSFLQEVISQYQITIMQATPATWRMLLNGGWQGSKRLKALCGGEALSVKFSDELCHYVGELWNMYGPTETTVCSTCLRIDEQRPKLYPYESIGKPLANTQIYILDEQLQPLAENIAGELYIGGAGVARGYLNRPDLTEERFIPNPFSQETDARIYKTGDLAKWLDDGYIEFLGRNDFQVKIRGFRIELGDIEAKLAEHSAIDDVAVIASEEDTNGNKRLIAYLVLKKDESSNSAELRHFLKQKMPPFMIIYVFRKTTDYC